MSLKVIKEPSIDREGRSNKEAGLAKLVQLKPIYEDTGEISLRRNGSNLHYRKALSEFWGLRRMERSPRENAGVLGRGGFTTFVQKPATICLGELGNAEV